MTPRYIPNPECVDAYFILDVFGIPRGVQGKRRGYSDDNISISTESAVVNIML